MRSYLPVAVRAWSEPAGEQINKRRRRRGNQREKPPGYALVFDTETASDAAQSLLFGSWRLFRIVWTPDAPVLVILEEGIFYADGLSDRDPEAFQTIQAYVREHSVRALGLSDDHPLAWPSLKLLSASEFVGRVLLPKAYDRRSWFVVGFNLPFDMSRIAAGWGEARGSMAGGFSLALGTYSEDGRRRVNPFRPWFRIKTVDSKRHLMSFARPARSRPQRHHYGSALDLRTLAFALTDQGHSLESACRAFGVPFEKREVRHGEVTPGYLDYNREDVWATGELLGALLAEHARHPVELPATRAYSPASVGKAYLRAMSIAPILERQPDFPAWVLAAGMECFYGGRAECRIRRVPVPVVSLDFLSMYPTVNALLGLWELVSAKRVEVAEDTEGVRDFVEAVTLEDCFRPETWRGLPALVQVVPEGDVLPVRAIYGPGGDWGIGVNSFWSQGPKWYALPDVMASKLLTGQTPRILRAVRLRAVGRQEGLNSVLLRGKVQVDPARSDFFRSVIEERHRLPNQDVPDEERSRLDRFLKVLANAASYGIYAEIVRHERSGRVPVSILRPDGSTFMCLAPAVEEPGQYAFPPIAALITSAARLMLTMLEACVAKAGGVYANCDTDSMTVVATEGGGLVACPGGSHRTADGRQAIRAVSWAEVDAIVSLFAALNPYDRGTVSGSILRVEHENFEAGAGNRRQLYCFAISAKRYALLNLGDRGEPVVRWASQHGLGHLLNPMDPEAGDPAWINEIWEMLIAEGYGIPVTEPDWLERPALSRVTASTPVVLRPFAYYNEGKSYADKVKPFNFLLSAHVAPFGHPEGVDPARFHLISHYEQDPRRWEHMNWVDLYSRKAHKITTKGDWFQRPDLVRVKTYRDVVAEYRFHPEAKSLGLDGLACTRASVGLTARRPMAPSTVYLIGKESNHLEDIQAGLVHDPSEVLNEYADPDRNLWHALWLPALVTFSTKEIQDASGVPRRTVHYARGGRPPSSANRTRLEAAVVDLVRERLRDRGFNPPRDGFACLSLYLEENERDASGPTRRPGSEILRPPSLSNSSPVQAGLAAGMSNGEESDLCVR